MCIIYTSIKLHTFFIKQVGVHQISSSYWIIMFCEKPISSTAVIIFSNILCEYII